MDTTKTADESSSVPDKKNTEKEKASPSPPPQSAEQTSSNTSPTVVPTPPAVPEKTSTSSLPTPKNDTTDVVDKSTARCGSKNNTKEEKKDESIAKADNYHGNNSEFAIRMKPQYVLTERSPLLTSMDDVQFQPEHDNNNSNSNNNNNNKRSRRGQNRKRPRDVKTAAALKACLSVVRGTECPVGKDKCKYNHDLKCMLADRPDDITEIKTGCPHYNLHGRCDFGIMCRLGADSHLNMATGENLYKSEAVSYSATNNMILFGTQSKNALKKEVQIQLRKNKYPFVCQRKHGTNNNNTTNSTENTTTTVLSDKEPRRPRKLIDFRNKVYVAPLTTVGNLPFRRIMKHYQADITCGEMAVASHLLEGKPSEWALLRRHPSEDVFGIQVAAGFADQFTRCAELLEHEVDADFVDMNLGCPIDMICQKGAGAALMLRERRLKEAVIGMTNVLSVPVTIKIRTGWNDSDPFAHKLVPKIQGWGIDGIGAVMLHGRSRLQRYHRLANWDYIGRVANTLKEESSTIPLIGNGDIFSHIDYEQKVLNNPSSDEVYPTAMIARGALIKPWLPTEIKERRYWDISASERLDMLRDFVRFGLEHWGSDQQGVNTTRRFLLEWLSFLYRYVPVGLVEVLPQRINHRPPMHTCGRSDLETLMMSKHCGDWIKISEMLLGKVPEDFRFEPKHKASGYK